MSKIMIAKTLRKAIFTCCLLGAFSILPSAQNYRFGVVIGTSNASQQLVKYSTYEKVLNKVFPLNDLPKSNTLFSITIRYLPNSEPESQIMLVKSIKNKTISHKILIRESKSNIWHLLNNILDQGIEEDVGKMAEQVVIIQREIPIKPNQLKSIYEQFLASLPKTMAVINQEGLLYEKNRDERLLLHGTRYELRYEQGENIFYFDLYDTGREKPVSIYPLTQWMKALKKAHSLK